MICEICKEFETKTFRGLSLHIRNNHNFDIKEYYDIYLKKDAEGICTECGKETSFISLTKGYFNFCSSKCSNSSKNTRQKIEQTKLNKYGDIKYNNKEKSSQTWRNKTIEEIADIVDKRRITKNKIYGDEKFNNRDKAKKTCIDRYGVKHFTNRKKYIKTCLDRYGVENPFQLEEVKEEIRKYFLDNFGVDHPMKIEKVKNKVVNGVNNFYKNKNEEMFKKYFKILKYKDENNIHVRCKNCGCDFWIQKQYFIWRFNKKVHPCYKCYNLSNISIYEKELFDFIEINYNGEIIKNYRKLIYPYELDIYIPELKLAFEFNGLYWHNEKFVDKNYHLNKTELCEEKGIHLVQIYEDDWVLKKDVVKSRILNLLGKSKKIYARKCIIKEVTFKDAKEFLEENHLQGYCVSKINYGLYYNDELLSLMTFSKLRKSLGFNNVNGSYELLRFCNKLNTTVVGATSRLFKSFLNNYKPEIVISYADRFWTTIINGVVYEKIGFELVGKTTPNYFYVHNKIRRNRFNYRKDILIKQGFDKNKTEHDIMYNRGIYRIYNSGNLKYVYKK